MNVRRVRILDIPVDIINKKRAQKKVEEMLMENKSHTIIAINPEKVIAARHDSTLKEALENADLLLPDGAGLVWAARIFGYNGIQRIPGADFMENICKIAAKRNCGVFIYGSREEVNRKATQILQKRYPRLRIAGRCHGYIDEEKMDELVEIINASGAIVLFVALGSPKQEKWMMKYLPRLNKVRICQGIGGTLDTLAGYSKRAPKWIQYLQAEWLYRLLREPWRIKRQKALIQFAKLVLKEKAR